MSESAALIAAFFYGIAVGAVIVSSVVIVASRLSTHLRVAALFFAISMFCWVIGECLPLWNAFGQLRIIDAFDMPSAAFFWLFALAIVSDLKVTPLTLLPAVALVVSGFVQLQTRGAVSDVLWIARNLFGASLAVHVAWVVIGGWRDDLVEGRRRFRALLLVAACIYVVVNIAVAFATRADPQGPWSMFLIGRPIAGFMLVLLLVGFGVLCLQPRPSVFGPARRAEPTPDPRIEAAERVTLDKLASAMRAEGWRRERLTIGDLASELATPEHRLRRLINQRLGFRNFADFVNSYRIEAAKRRLADPAEARSTVAAIAFDLGYGSLGPFNRAFRAATGASPTEWRRQALAAEWPKMKEAV